VTSQGNTLLARTFSLIHLGDWVSYYLAVINGTDPTPVPLIEDLKKKLAG
jgi:glucose/mannose-6-phosphate isomerase